MLTTALAMLASKPTGARTDTLKVLMLSLLVVMCPAEFAFTPPPGLAVALAIGRLFCL